MSNENLLLVASGLLVKIHVITGWVIPDSYLMDILVDQFQKKLIERYRNCNADEFEHAFRNYSADVVDWGKNMNLMLIDQVMEKFINARTEVSRIEEQEKAKIRNIEYKEDMSEKALADWWKYTEIKVQEGGYKVELLPLSLYEWMDKQGGIKTTNKEKREYQRKAMQFRYTKLLGLYETNTCDENKNALYGFKKMMDEGCFVGKEINRINEMAKRMILYDMMKNKT